MTPSGAVFSPDRKYRYTLWRKWGESNSILVFAMLNPSTATETILDPTVSGCLKRAQAWGYSALVVLNLFAYRSTDPKALRQVDDPVGPGNDEAIMHWARRTSTFVCAWGSSSPLIQARAVHVLLKLQEAKVKLHYLRLSEKTGQPGHPLYIPHALKPTPWENAV